MHPERVGSVNEIMPDVSIDYAKIQTIRSVLGVPAVNRQVKNLGWKRSLRVSCFTPREP